jgi:uncharacterized protein (DUF58 family)
MVYFPYLPTRSELSADLELHFDRRGRYSEDSFGLATRFPFAFLTKTRHIALRREIVVYPPVDPTDEFYEILPLINGELESYVRGRGSDLYRIREYMPEDSARHVDWKASAKSGSLKVREFSREDERRLRLVFDNPASGTVSSPAYERAVNLAASLAWHFSTQDVDVSYVIPGYPRGTDVHEFLARLAVIQPQGEGPAVEAVTAERTLDVLDNSTLGESDEYNIVLTAGPRDSLPTVLWNSSYFIFIQGQPESRVQSVK